MSIRVPAPLLLSFVRDGRASLDLDPDFADIISHLGDYEEKSTIRVARCFLQYVENNPDSTQFAYLTPQHVLRMIKKLSHKPLFERVLATTQKLVEEGYLTSKRSDGTVSPLITLIQNPTKEAAVDCLTQITDTIRPLASNPQLTRAGVGASMVLEPMLAKIGELLIEGDTVVEFLEKKNSQPIPAITSFNSLQLEMKNGLQNLVDRIPFIFAAEIQRSAGWQRVVRILQPPPNTPGSLETSNSFTFTSPSDGK